ncbi:sensor histidine kinase [Radicibacter daui]|uniref:sensor histidine kinase n=1 Tax=Radicibacter daui TaxID=3064829 RepID=UPI0040469D2B
MSSQAQTTGEDRKTDVRAPVARLLPLYRLIYSALRIKPLDGQWPVFWRQFGVLGILLLFFWLACSAGGLWFARQQSEIATRVEVEDLADRLATWFGRFAAQFFVEARSPLIGRLLASGNATDERLITERFVVTMQEEPGVRHLRYLDLQGNELLRIDRTQTGIIPAGKDALQNKAERYYFTETMKLQPGELYISPLDLNIEYKKIVVPWEPTIRFSTRVVGADDTPAGALVANLDPQDLLARFSLGERHSGLDRWLLNQDGFWLAGRPSENLWGFMLGTDFSLRKENETLWSVIKASESGNLSQSGIEYSFITVDPGKLSSAYLSEGHKVITPDVFHIVVADHYGLRFLRWSLWSLPLLGLGLLVLASVSWYRSAGVILRRRARLGEEQLARTERMASLGELVAGVAHELNTPIGNAVTIASTLQDRMAAFSREIAAGPVRKASFQSLMDDLGQGTALMLSGLERAASLIGQFKQVAVDQTSEQRRVFNLDDYVSQLATSIRPTFKHTPIELDLVTRSGLELDSYPGALAQVVMNLVNNAVLHGFDAGEAGTITLESGRTEDGMAVISVTDTGRGIPLAFIERIFDPFFTTRSGTGGSGLGLSIVHNIVVELLGGSVSVASQPGGPTVFSLKIPLKPRPAPSSSED